MDKRISILVLLPFSPFPPDDGGKIASYTFIENLRDVFDFTVLVQVNNPEEVVRVDAQRSLWPNVNLVSVQPKVAGIRGRFFSIARKIYPLVKKWITFEKGVFFNSDMLYPFLRTDVSYFNAVHSLISNNNFDIVQVEYVYNLPLVNLIPERVRKIYVEVESRYSLLSDFVALESSGNVDYKKYVVENVKAIESAFLSRYDAVVTYSADDQKRLQRLLPGKVVYRSPLNLINDPDDNVSFENFSIEKIVFVGHESHPPNRDAVIWFVENIFPKLSGYNKKLYILGKWSKSFCKKYSSSANVVFAGYIEDINSFIRNSINVVPIRLGGCGLRMKVLLSISNGVPVVCTSKAGFGFDFSDGENVIFAETENEFVNKISILLDDPDKARVLAKKAYRLYRDSYSVARTTEIRSDIYNDVMRCKH